LVVAHCLRLVVVVAVQEHHRAPAVRVLVVLEALTQETARQQTQVAAVVVQVARLPRRVVRAVQALFM
jgi:hypothetical protein